MSPLILEGQNNLKFTDDELVTTIEALREYHLRVADASRRTVTAALIYRLGAELVASATATFKAEMGFQ